MFQRQRNWWTEVIWKPKKAHSLEQLRYHHYILMKNAVVTDQNRSLLVETFRSIAEILIWGDQNDSTVFDFFLEKNMLFFFLKILNQNPGAYVCVQLLQTLNILFENIRHETSLYYLLSNNHVNSIIIHKFDFTNEEILAYYISFLKTLSLKLNLHVINFFFNERKSDFALYTEALKFFDHKENMVRIAVRTLTLNVFRVSDKAMLNFIVNKTADAYFCNLIWYIGNHAMELDRCSVKESDHLHCGRLKDLVADHLDHLHYINDILCLNILELNEILTEYLLDRLIIPLYLYSLVADEDAPLQCKPQVGKLFALYLLSQILLIIKHPPLVSTLTDVILQGEEINMDSSPSHSPLSARKSGVSTGLRVFAAPESSLEQALLACGINSEGYTITNRLNELARQRSRHVANSKFYTKGGNSEKKWRPDEARQRARREEGNKNDVTVSESVASPSENDVNGRGSPKGNLSDSREVSMGDTPLGQVTGDDDDGDGLMINSSNEASNEVKGFTTEESAIPNRVKVSDVAPPLAKSFLVRPVDFQPDRTYVETLIKSLDCSRDDREALFTLCLFHSLIKNPGVDPDLLRSFGLFPSQQSEHYNDDLIQALIKIMEQASKHVNKVRLVTLQMGIILLKQLVYNGHPGETVLKDFHLALLENVRESCTLELRNYYKGDDVFLDMFEAEYRQMKVKPLNVEHLMMDASLLLPVTATPLTGIEFSKRLACGEVEHTQRAVRVFLMVRELSLTVRREPERQLPLSKVEYSVKESEVLDLNNSDLISCTVVDENRTLRRFLVIDEAQFILVEPDTTRLGWGVVKFVALLQDVEISPDKDDSRSLFITIHEPFARSTRGPRRPLLTAKFMFDDYIRCMSAKQRLHRRRTSLRHIKLQRIAQLLELPIMAGPAQQFFSMTPPSFSQPSIASPQGFRSRPGGAVAVSDVTSNSEEKTIDEPLNTAVSTNTDMEDESHRMAAPESCLHPSQTAGDQARTLASVLDISDQRNTPESDDVIELASDVLDASSSDDAMSSQQCDAAMADRKCPSAPATPRGQRRFGNSEFHIIEWRVSDLNRNNSMSEPSLLLQHNDLTSSGDSIRP
ncbi:protein CLEC16A-like [Dendronephthya gigantea]|uniref:protein CLEC16A-like n=1 Tax=Dendronephthya gigantea TaxID=151771 RepID=UPI00106C1636|nr:protein CLEC16A-like [Dendronephthya gigantea]